MTQTMYITIDGATLPVTLVDNAATQALVAALSQGAISYEADDYGDFEKVGGLGRSLPGSDQQIKAEAGDVILYNGDQIVLFYGSNSWSYTRLGRIRYESSEELRDFLKAGQGRISVTLSLSHPTGIERVPAQAKEPPVYTLQGRVARAGAGGFLIQNGEKIIRRQ
ncbi:MAG: hypothetical protein IJ154_01740 [Bacteroidales bacterium]|nr:hypothetical protein [Bacteroidales bacterium]